MKKATVSRGGAKSKSPALPLSVGDGEVRPALFSLMILVEANPGVAQIDIANQLDIDKATVVGLVGEAPGRGDALRYYGNDRAKKLPQQNDVEIMNAGFMFQEGGPHVSEPPPGHGQHSEEVRRWLGFDELQRRQILA